MHWPCCTIYRLVFCHGIVAKFWYRRYFHLNSKLQSLSLWQIRKKPKKEPRRWGVFLCSEQFLMYPDIPSRQWAILSVVLKNRYSESLCSNLCCLLPTPLRLNKDLSAYLIQAYEQLCLAKNYWQFIMCGDFNFFCTDNVIAECNLTQINFEPTHNNKVLDKVLLSCPWNLSTVQTVIPTVSTDHDSVLCSLQIPKNGKKSSISETNVKVAAKCVTNFFVMRPITVCTDQWIPTKLCVN